jgi:glutamyl-tRNA reductase
VLVVGLSHHTAPIAVRERLAVSGDAQQAVLERLHRLESVAEVVLVSTCNRVEVYAAAAPDVTPEAAASAITSVLGDIGGREIVPHLRTATELGAVRHLLRVACSLDSLVVGEPQILGQLKDAIRSAESAGTVGPKLASVLRHALQVAKRVRTDTEIGAGQVSVPTVAVELAHRIFESFRGHVALLVGAGEMAEAAAKLFAQDGARLLVANRSPARAVELANAVGGEPRPWDELGEALVQADIVVTSTASPTPVVTKDLVRAACKRRRGRSLFLIDIAVPRDVAADVNELENVYVYDIDDLSRAVARTIEGRAAEAERAEAMVQEETRAFATRRSQDHVRPTVVALRERFEGVLRAELERSVRGRLKHLSTTDREALEAMLQASVNKLLHAPTTHLKELAIQQRSEEAVALLVELFDLEESAPRVDAPDPHEGAAPDAPREGPKVAAR